MVDGLTKLQGDDELRRQYMGDSIGKEDKNGIAEWYPQCKVRFDGGSYIATPHTTNPAKRRKRIEETITVTVQDGKYTLEDKLQNEPVEPDSVSVEEVDESPPERSDEPKKDIRHMTKKQIFDELYDKYLSMKRKARQRAIYEDIKHLFQKESEAKAFVEDNCLRRWRNIVVRRQRFARKAYNQHFQWFVTFTYTDEKHTEESFKQRLQETLRRLATRHNWLYMGVWERGKDTNRLHFHALVYIPEGEMVGEFEKVTDYNKKTGKQKMITQNTFFAEKFGRNEFDNISFCDMVYGKAIGYIMKYMEKNNAKTVYSRGLYEYFLSDIQGKDVIAKFEISNETDNRLILADDFVCWDNGVKVGKVSRETIAQMPKAN